MASKPPPPSSPRRKRKPKPAKAAKGQRLSERPEGRPHSCTNKVIARLCHALGNFASNRDAAFYAGIGPRTFNRWENRATDAFKAAGLDPEQQLEFPETEGDDGQPGQAEWESLVEEEERIFCRFWLLTRRARSTGNVKALENIVEHSKLDWRAGAKLIAIRDPDNYAETRRMEHSGPKGEPVGVRIYLPEEEEET